MSHGPGKVRFGEASEEQKSAVILVKDDLGPGDLEELSFVDPSRNRVWSEYSSVDGCLVETISPPRIQLDLPRSYSTPETASAALERT